MFDLHRTHQSSVTALFSQSSPEVISAAVPGPKTKFKQGLYVCQQRSHSFILKESVWYIKYQKYLYALFKTLERDLVGLDLQTPRLVFLVSEADLTSENEEELSIRKSIMKHFPQISVQGNLLDAHLYVIKKWVCDYIAENRYVQLITII